MQDTPRYVTLRDYLRVVRAHRILIAFVTIVFGAAALVYSVRQDPTYASESALAFSDPTQDLELLGSPAGVNQPAGERAAIGADLVERAGIIEAVRKSLDRRTADDDELRAMVTARPEARTNLVVIEARHENARFSALVANAYAREVRDFATEEERERLDSIADELREEYRKTRKRANETTRTIFADRISRIRALRDFAQPVEIAKTAGVPDAPVEPQPIRNTALGLLLGLTIGLLLAFGRDAMDRRLRTARDVEEEMALPLVGQLSDKALGRALLSKNGSKPFPPGDAESIRILRTNLSFIAPGADVRVLLVTSVMPEEGKSTVASALAITAAQGGRKVLLIECDLRRPSLSGRLPVKQGPGLGEVLTDGRPWQEVKQTIPAGKGPGSLDVISAGAERARPAELLDSRAVRKLLVDARQVYDLVILDGTPLLAVVDARELLPLVDAAVVCVRASRTTRDQAKAARQALDRLPSRPAGLVVTGVKPGEEQAYGYYTYGDED